MAFKDLRQYITYVETLGELKHVNGANWDLEIGGVSYITSLMKNPPAVLFDDIVGYPKGFRVYCDQIWTEARMRAVLGIDSKLRGTQIVKAWKQKLSSYRPVEPKEVDSGPVQENVMDGDEVDLWKFPSPRWFEDDGGRYLGTGCMVIIRDPDDGWVNLGTYRIQVHDKNTAGIFVEASHHGGLMMQKYWERGMNCPVAVSFGQEPCIWVAAARSIPWGHSEYSYAGWLRGEPVEVVRGPLTDLPLPANAEIVIEGEVPPPTTETRLEGPFGEWEGYYASGARQEPVIKVKRVMYRDNPIIYGQQRIRPRSLGVMNIFTAAKIWDDLEKCGVSDIKAVWMAEGCGTLMCIISIAQKYEGHAKRAGLVATSGAGADQGRLVVIVDEDIDVTNTRDVLWAIGTRWDPELGVDIIPGLNGRLVDPLTIVRGDKSTPRAILYACRPYRVIQKYPKTVTITEELKQRVLKKWNILS